LSAASPSILSKPLSRYDRKLAGAATYFALAASFFTDVRVIAVVGEDFGPEEEAVFRGRNIDIRGIERAPGKSFFWEGAYLDNLNEAQTRNTELNVFASFEPKIPTPIATLTFFFLPTSIRFCSVAWREAMPG